MLSKSQYAKYTQCPKLFWLSRNGTSKLTPGDAQQRLIFENGTLVGEAARGLFPDGKKVNFNIDDITGMCTVTRQHIDSGTTTIYEAAFVYEDVFAAVDILHWRNGFWHIYEVKSSTDLKDAYTDDAAVQAWVVESCGLKIDTVNVIHINNRYVRDGELDLTALFSIRNVTAKVNLKKREVSENVAAMKMVLQGREPEKPVGPHCLSPYKCAGMDYCWKILAGIPERSVFTLTGARRERKFELYESGVIEIGAVPLDECSPAQKLQVQGELHIEVEPIRTFVATLEYPMTHLDFESFQQAIPEYQGVRAYSQIPFQYSLHIEIPENGNPANRLVHKEYLSPVGTDPRRELAERLLTDIPESGTVLVYNQVFEKGIIGKLAAAFPDLAAALNALNNRIADLARPFDKRWYYHPAQNGSWSIKKVLPAIVPDMARSYASLPGVNNGGEASALWTRLPAISDPVERETIRMGLLAYCELDTLAMVRILEVLKAV